MLEIVNTIYRILDHIRYIIKNKYSFLFVYKIGDYIEYGPHSMMRRDGIIQSSERGTVTIGDWCSIGKNVRILGFTHSSSHPTGPNRRLREAPVVIGDYVWIGNNVIIAPGVTIGDHAVIGANSVVRKNVPANGYVRVVCEYLARRRETNVKFG